MSPLSKSTQLLAELLADYVIAHTDWSIKEVSRTIGRVSILEMCNRLMASDSAITMGVMHKLDDVRAPAYVYTLAQCLKGWQPTHMLYQERVHFDRAVLHLAEVTLIESVIKYGVLTHELLTEIGSDKLTTVVEKVWPLTHARDESVRVKEDYVVTTHCGRLLACGQDGKSLDPEHEWVPPALMPSGKGCAACRADMKSRLEWKGV